MKLIFMRIILASASKRRSSILDSCGLAHKIVVSNAREAMEGSSPINISIKNARLKAMDVARRSLEGYVIGADTVVLLGKEVIGKPRDFTHAKSMLKRMSGRKVFVYTGLCVIDVKKKRIASGYEMSAIFVNKIREQDFSKVLKLLGPYDKAGGFSIEGVGSFIFDDIKGSYFNILGLPMGKLKSLFDKLKVDLLDYVKT